MLLMSHEQMFMVTIKHNASTTIWIPYGWVHHVNVKTYSQTEASKKYVHRTSQEGSK